MWQYVRQIVHKLSFLGAVEISMSKYTKVYTKKCCNLVLLTRIVYEYFRNSTSNQSPTLPYKGLQHLNVNISGVAVIFVNYMSRLWMMMMIYHQVRTIG